MQQCGDAVGCSAAHIHKVLHAAGAPVRDKGAARRGTGSARFMQDGYWFVYDQGRVAKGGRPFVLEHRLVMERVLNRRLTPREVVHHINGIRHDNRPENLRLFTNNAEHMKHHVSGRPWSRLYDRCITCGVTDRRHAAQGICIRCYNREAWSR